MKKTKTLSVATRRFTGMFLFAAVVLGSVRVGFAFTTTFTGAGDWDEPSRWSAGVPDDGDDAVVAGTVTTRSSPER